MAKRFLISLALILAFLIGWSVVLFFWIAIWGSNDKMMIIGMFISLPIIIIHFIFYLNFVIKKAFSFPGEGDPVPEASLRKQIADINHYDVPIMVQEKGNALIITWRYVDAKWWELFAKAGMSKLYQLHIKLDDAKKEALLIDVEKSVSWRTGPTEVSIWGGFFRGVIMQYEIGKAWGIRENFTLGKIYDYQFTPSEIKNPVMNTILQNGWTVKFAMW